MERVEVKSSNIKSVGYDSNLMILEVEFLNSGIVYQYFNVPVNVVEKWLNDDSIGVYFCRNIKDQYEYEKVV